MTQTKKRIGVIGCGQWGPNQIRTFFFHPAAEVRRVCDKDPGRVSAMQGLYPGVEGTQDFRSITRADDIDAVVITTPVSTHFKIAQDALLHGKDVLCEKPLTIRVREAETLAALAERRKRILMVGHVFLFNPGIVRFKELLRSGEFGRAYYLHAQRTNLGPVRSDASAVYDLASHDVSIFNFLLNAKPRVIAATGKCYLQPGVEDVAFVSLAYPRDILAHIHVSWLDPKKVRRITAVGEKQMMIWDDLSSTGPLEIYGKHVEHERSYKDFGEFHLLVKDGDVRIPSVKNAEPLKVQADHFMQCLFSRKRPLTDGRFAVDVVRTLAEIEKVLLRARR